MATNTVLGFAFPFRPGPQGFPQMVSGTAAAVSTSIRSLLATGFNERVMRGQLGTNVHAFVFDNLSGILNARIGAAIARALALYEPRAELLSVETQRGADIGMEDTALLVTVVYRVNNELVSQQVPVQSVPGLTTP